MSCDEACVDKGIKDLITIIEVIIQGAVCNDKTQPCDISKKIIDQLTNSLNTLRCQLPKNISTKIETIITKIRAESSSVTKVNLLYVMLIFGTLLVLIIFLYLAIYLKNDTYTLIFGIISVILIIAAAIGLLYGVSTIYTTSADNVSSYFTELNTLLTKIGKAVDQSFCCLGNCGGPVPCPSVFNCET